MNKKYAMEILDSVECRTFPKDSPLTKEAFRYLKRLKSTSDGTINRIYKIEYSNN